MRPINQNQTKATKMNLYDYKTGTMIRPLTEAEATRYLALADTREGAVDGAEFGHDGTVFAN